MEFFIQFCQYDEWWSECEAEEVLLLTFLREKWCNGWHSEAGLVKDWTFIYCIEQCPWNGAMAARRWSSTPGIAFGSSSTCSYKYWWSFILLQIILTSSLLVFVSECCKVYGSQSYWEFEWTIFHGFWPQSLRYFAKPKSFDWLQASVLEIGVYSLK